MSALSGNYQEIQSVNIYVPPSPNQRYVDLRIGKTGSGKSYGAARLFETCPRAFVVERGYSEFKAQTFQEYSEAILYLDKLGAFENKSVPFRVSYSPRISEYDLMFQTALELGEMFLFLEEASRFNLAECPNYDEVITQGRHYGISIACMTTRAYKVPIDLRGQVTHLTSFQQTEPRDIDWMREQVGDLADEIPKLPGPPQKPPFPYLIWDGLNGARIVKP